MPIENDRTLQVEVAAVGSRLQEIQDYLGDRNISEGKVRFPRKYIRTAEYFRSGMPFILDASTRDNIAYALILMDVYRWLLNRTDLFGTAREMIIKSGIVLSGSVCETLMVTYTRGVVGRQCKFDKRCDRMFSEQMIDRTLRDELKWLWTIRSGIHIADVTFREYDHYKISDQNRAARCLQLLRDQLNAHSTANAAF